MGCNVSAMGVRNMLEDHKEAVELIIDELDHVRVESRRERDESHGEEKRDLRRFNQLLDDAAAALKAAIGYRDKR